MMLIESHLMEGNPNVPSNSLFHPLHHLLHPLLIINPRMPVYNLSFFIN